MPSQNFPADIMEGKKQTESWLALNICYLFHLYFVLIRFWFILTVYIITAPTFLTTGSINIALMSYGENTAETWLQAQSHRKGKGDKFKN